MILALFWIKIAVKRIVYLLKSSPLMFIWVFIIIGAFIFAVSNRHLVINPEITQVTFFILFLFICSIVRSFRNFNAAAELIRFSKSRYSNNKILFRFFLKKAAAGNILLIIISLLSFEFVPYDFYFFVFLGIAVFSVFMSFSIMHLKYKYLHVKKSNKERTRLKINPLIKSIFNDYLTIDFSAIIIICSGAFFFFTAELIKNSDYFLFSDNQSYVFIFMLAVFSVGFSGVIDSVSGINWKLHAILSKNSFLYHYIRILIFFAFVYGIIFACFIVIGSFINIFLLIKYIFCIFINMFISVNIAFCAGNKLIKGIIFLFLTAATIYISTLNAGFLAVLLLPAAITFFKAKNDIREWSLL